MSDPIFDEIARYDDAYKPQHAVLPGLDSLPDGDYDFEITSAVLGRTQNSGEAILKLALRVGTGATVERAYFFSSQQAVDQLGMDLCAMGLDCHGKRPFSQELKAALSLLKGVRFRGRKSTRHSDKNKRDYHDLFVAGRIGAAAPSRVTPPPAVVAQAPSANHQSDDIPF